MSRVDSVTGLSRGYLLVSTHAMLQSALFTLDLSGPEWRQAASFVQAAPGILNPALIRARAAQLATVVDGTGTTAAAEAGLLDEAESNPELYPMMAKLGLDPLASQAVLSALRHLAQCTPWGSVSQFLVERGQGPGSQREGCVPAKAREGVLAELRALPLYQVRAGQGNPKGILTILTVHSTRSPSVPTTTYKSSGKRHWVALHASFTASLPTLERAGRRIDQGVM